MIERQTIKGREATVAYLTSDLQPTDKAEAELIKVIFDDGQHLWLVPTADDQPTEDQDVDRQISDWFRGNHRTPGNG